MPAGTVPRRRSSQPGGAAPGTAIQPGAAAAGAAGAGAAAAATRDSISWSSALRKAGLAAGRRRRARGGGGPGGGSRGKIRSPPPPLREGRVSRDRVDADEPSDAVAAADDAAAAASARTVQPHLARPANRRDSDSGRDSIQAGPGPQSPGLIWPRAHGPPPRVPAPGGPSDRATLHAVRAAQPGAWAGGRGEGGRTAAAEGGAPRSALRGPPGRPADGASATARQPLSLRGPGPIASGPPASRPPGPRVSTAARRRPVLRPQAQVSP